ncbi:MAG TPA: hypothetical protein DDY43_09500 [Synechococcales bacterium UBA10510]|nr:hypothetical protein [Synechococcales bacterium UBA10510]
MSDSTLSISGGSIFDGQTAAQSNTTYSAGTSKTNDSVVLSGGSLTNIGLNTGAGEDTLVIDTILTADRTAPKDFWSLRLGGQNDIGTFNSSIAGYNVQASGGDDTLVINGPSTNTVFSGGQGSDLLVVNGVFAGGQIAATGAVAGGPTNTQINDGADTIVLDDATKVTGVLINQFSITGSAGNTDTLIIGTATGDITITAADFAGSGAVAGTYGKAGGTFGSILNTANNADIAALNDWLTAGSNRITLI